MREPHRWGLAVSRSGYFQVSVIRPGHRPAIDGLVMFDAGAVAVNRYRWRGNHIPTPWTSTTAPLVPV